MLLRYAPSTAVDPGGFREARPHVAKAQRGPSLAAQNECRNPTASTEGSEPAAVAAGVMLVLDEFRPNRPVELLRKAAYEA